MEKEPCREFRCFELNSIAYIANKSCCKSGLKVTNVKESMYEVAYIHNNK